jgi:hypothetical protein
MYLDEVFNNFLGTLRATPDIRFDNPGLEQGKFVNDRSRYYSGKTILISTDGSIDGSARTTEITIQKPDIDLIERSSGPEFGTIMEGFTAGVPVRTATHEKEGLQNQGSGSTSGSSADLRAYQQLSDKYDEEYKVYADALKSYNIFKQNSNFRSFLNSFIKVVTKAGSVNPVVAEEFEIYYVNAYGYRYRMPKVTPGSTLPTETTPRYDPTATPKIVTLTQLAAFPTQGDVSTAKYEIKSGQNMTLAGKFVKCPPPGSGSSASESGMVYAWVSIEGVAHIFNRSVLSDTVNNCHVSCWDKLKSGNVVSFDSLESLKIALGGMQLISPAEVTDANFICSEMPSRVLALKSNLDKIEEQLKVASQKLKIERVDISRTQNNNHSSYLDSQGELIQRSTQHVNSNLNEYVDIKKNMVTYDGKVSDSSMGVKSKLGYYILWLSLMIFIVVVTFRNMASSESTESGSFMISAALLIILMIYLFNYLSQIRLGPQQLVSKIAGDLPEKVSGMMKFTFT